MEEIRTSERYREAVQSGRVVVEFYATWCPDCRRIEPYLGGWEEKYREQFALVRVNRDEVPDLAEELQILGIPTFLVYDQGREVKRLFSRDAKSKEQVEQFLDQAYA
ncbi:thioredoxin family protein [Alicyclobacillus mali]|uniref:Thioredoxin n=1 Tax=Alicyclobacillus mali (ex Roth et al. 2021) TaxID=1123961 RepID=A0ABS0F348_9BACL|nr:thioredoxin family protein [Alicyclobacillus mali (ex Roth et al. 2021)]MBF8377728.1 thioredoxin family protein [Alicyclobacillus mali (ex Roth et al. 2021)]MCL6488251.1 thioredoxin family protein [Alicyclobacillus mali (ex Roth et al. 2021)]